MKKRILSVFMAIVMAVSLLPVSVFAEDTVGHTHGDVTFTEWTAASGTLTSGNYYLSESNATALTAGITIPVGETVTLCLNGNTLSFDSHYITNNGTLTICDCGEGGKITATTTTTSYGVVVNYGTFTITSGTLERPNKAYGLENYGEATVSGGTLYGKSSGIRNRSTGSLTITDGTITCGTTGYALQTDSEKDMNISGGQFSGKYALFTNPGSTGNVYISGGTFEGTGSGIHLQGTGTVFVNNGNISGIYGIYNYSTATVDMSGGTITATGSWGIYNFKAGKVTVSGGNITSQKIGIYNSGDGSVEMTGGTVTGTNETGIVNDGAGSVTVSGGTLIGKMYGISAYGTGSVFFDDDAQINSEGIGIYVYKGSLTVAGGSIICTGDYGISNGASGTVTVSGGTITGKYYGISNKGALYLSESPTFSNNSTGNGAITLGDGYTVHAKDSDGNKYAGETLNIWVVSQTEGKVVICEVDDSNKDKFALINTSSGYVLKQSGDNLILGLPHSHSWSTEWTTDEDYHWHECTADDCDVTEDSQKDSYGSHTPKADDGNCTTAIYCEACGKMMEEAQQHSYVYEVSTYQYTAEKITETCSNEGCNHNAYVYICPSMGNAATYTGNKLHMVLIGVTGNLGAETPEVVYERNGIIVPEVKDAGSYTASITIDDKTASLNFTVYKANPSEYTVPTGITAVYSQTLADVALPEGWSWADNTQNVGDVGTNTFKAIFTPEDSENYRTIENIDVQLTVVQAENSWLTIPKIQGWTYGENANTPEAEAKFGTVEFKCYDADKNELTSAPENAGTYFVKGFVAETENYSILESDYVEFIIAPGELKITDFTTDTNGFVYNGNEHKPNVESNNPLVTTNDFEVAYAGNISAGTDTAKIVITGKGNASGTVEITFSIAKANPNIATLPTASRLIAGELLSASVLTGSASVDGIFAWENGDEIMGSVGNFSKAVVFTPIDTANYNCIGLDVNVNVVECNTPTGNHDYSTFEHSDTEHWYICTGCENEKPYSREDHAYDNNCDVSCNVCGYARELTFDVSAVATTTIYQGYALEKSVITGTLNGVDGTWQWKNPETKVEETGTYIAVFTPADGTAPLEVELEVRTCFCICHSDNVFLQFIFKVFITVCKVFGFFRNCVCGDVHYTQSLFNLIFNR